MSNYMDRLDKILTLLNQILDVLLTSMDAKDKPTHITEDQQAGAYVDREGDVWVRREDGWHYYLATRQGGVPNRNGQAFEEVTRYGPLRIATPDDLARVGVDDEPEREEALMEIRPAAAGESNADA